MIKHICRCLNPSKQLFRYNFSETSILEEKAYNKIIVTRFQDKFSLFIEEEETVMEFQNRMRGIFQGSSITAINPKQLTQTDPQEIEDPDKWYQSMKNFPIIDALITNAIVMCEMGQNGGKPMLAYGLEIAEHNLTNRLNIPEYIQEGIVELNTDWNNNLIVRDALSFGNIRRYSEGPLNAQKGALVSNKLSDFEEQILQSSIIALKQLLVYDEESKKSTATQSSIATMSKIMLLMTTNWAFLFAVTYGKYGWDVGQPIAYLTDLGVDLAAMLGIFQVDSVLKQKAKQQKEYTERIMALQANRNMHLWRVAYLSRKTLVD